MEKESKAEWIYNNTRRECKNHIKAWGYEEKVGFNKMSYNDNESMTQRTANAIRKIIEKERRYVTLDLSLGVLNNTEAEEKTKVLNMVEYTLNNQQNILDKWN